MTAGPYANCTRVSAQCPVEGELYGYAPILWLNLFLAIFFAGASGFHLWAGVSYRMWTFMSALAFGCLCESIGYAGRVMMHYNVWNNIGFQIQLDCLLQGPVYISAGIYLTLKHIVLNIDQKYSRVKAAHYTWIFISCDAISLCIQGIGGGIAAANDNAYIVPGTWVMIAGIAFQIIALVLFGYLLIEYFIRVFCHRQELPAQASETLNSHHFRWFMMAIIIGYLGILIRCIYRLPELLGGWGNSLMREEIPFISLESIMICISTLALSIFHPGWYFPSMITTKRAMNKRGPVLESDLVDR